MLLRNVVILSAALGSNSVCTIRSQTCCVITAMCAKYKYTILYLAYQVTCVPEFTHLQATQHSRVRRDQ